MSRIIANNIRHNDATADSLSFDSSARVGIGTSSPNRQLVVNGGTSEGVIQITNDTSGTASANGFELIHFTNGETQLLNRENGAMRFDTNGSERMRILAGGGLTFNGDTAAANALDDYEEGSWTPTILVGGTEVAAYAVQTGRYRKIGDMVVAMCNVGVNGNQTGGNTGSILVGGLPFTATALNIATTVHTEGLSNLTTQSIMFQLDSGLTRVALRSFTSGTFSALTHSNIQGTGFQGFNFVATYLT